MHGTRMNNREWRRYLKRARGFGIMSQDTAQIIPNGSTIEISEREHNYKEAMGGLAVVEIVNSFFNEALRRGLIKTNHCPERPVTS
jgi:hypothetical protein